ncbi:MAG: hypothetical protein KAU62_10485 [Candidatus Heimdallarchaeota archaeon]|nr:hypothetical protein [Candidatus Heimdallarchaeota archaeon]MCK4611571.1 hypothetical protein [Candidatus Heimdallarchaeota archaeon]
MIIKKYSSKLIAVVFGTILLFGVSPLISSARITVTIITPIPSDINRTWDDLVLLYDDHFHNSFEVYEEIEYIHDTVPELVDLEVIGQTYFGKDIISLRITNENRPVQKAKALVVSHHHGREQISIEIALRFVLYLLTIIKKMLP